MSYLVLARKYRPQTFDDVIGQEHIVSLLEKSIETGRIAHAFLLCGPRGIGKTSCARILAKCLNCEKGPTLKPCGTCFACQEIASANSFDVIEIDGASNRGIDEIRTLRENVKFAPSYGRYKIYIVDEVHMLTSEAFNALLKTLEEPPEHVKFIFATTESNKVPATILSRCQRFDFKRISIDMMAAHLKAVCAKESISVDDEALFAISKAAQGSMRDALSVLDQMSALGSQGLVKASDVFAMLGMVELELLFALTDAIVARDCAKTLSVFNDVIERGKDLKQLGRDLVEHFRHLMIVKVGGPSLSALIDYPAAVKQRLAKQSEGVAIGFILKAIDVLIEAQETARVMESLRMPLEIAFAKLTLSSTASVAQPVIAPQTSSAPVVQKPVVMPQAQSSQKPLSVEKPRSNVTAAVKTTAPVSVPNEPAVSTTNGVEISIADIQTQWNALTHEVSKRKMSLATYLQDATPYAMKASKLTLAFTPDQRFQKESLETKDNIAIIEKAFTEKLGTPVYIGTIFLDGIATKKEEAVVKDALETFGGEVIKEWHND